MCPGSSEMFRCLKGVEVSLMEGRWRSGEPQVTLLDCWRRRILKNVEVGRR